MSFRDKALAEMKAIALVTAFFAAWFCVLVFLKSLILADYQIQFRGWSVGLVGALIVAKVVLLLEHISLGTWVRRQPAALKCCCGPCSMRSGCSS